MAQIYQTLAVACEDNQAQQASASAMLKKLEDMGQLDNTIVVVTTDDLASPSRRMTLRRLGDHRSRLGWCLQPRPAFG